MNPDLDQVNEILNSEPAKSARQAALLAALTNQRDTANSLLAQVTAELQVARQCLAEYSQAVLGLQAQCAMFKVSMENLEQASTTAIQERDQLSSKLQEERERLTTLIGYTHYVDQQIEEGVVIALLDTYTAWINQPRVRKVYNVSNDQLAQWTAPTLNERVDQLRELAEQSEPEEVEPQVLSEDPYATVLDSSSQPSKETFPIQPAEDAETGRKTRSKK
jgi:chromosome segregation ATPase